VVNRSKNASGPFGLSLPDATIVCFHTAMFDTTHVAIEGEASFCQLFCTKLEKSALNLNTTMFLREAFSHVRPIFASGAMATFMARQLGFPRDTHQESI